MATLLAAAGLGFTHYEINRQSSEANLEQLLKLSASESAMRVARWLEGRRDSAASIAGSATLIEELRRIQQLTPDDDEYFLALYRLKRELDRNTLSHRFVHEITIHNAETGDIVLRLPFPEESGLNLKKFNPTAITVAPNGDIILSDGYASNHIFKFDRNGKYLMHFGSKGNDLKQFNTAR